ncbi:hypothetical protein AVEN_262013-1 [Araneus ventricosus]|uniref:Uncharacterized protein n=1 Tax=Araneus ventricosus TaxID=182803 RepID=A0A4Y2WY32_ARAVE|nr:hypothetical protein AVEN_262013-1 [Araneus ventricosus]
MYGKGLPRDRPLLLGRNFGRRVLSNVTLRSLRQYPVEPAVNEIVSLANIRGLEEESNDIDELVEEQNQELNQSKSNTMQLMELYCVPQQQVMEESLSEEEEVTAKQQSSSAVREMLKARETVASYIGRHHPNKAEAMRATNLFYDNAVSHFRQILKRPQKQMSVDIFILKKN